MFETLKKIDAAFDRNIAAQLQPPPKYVVTATFENVEGDGDLSYTIGEFCDRTAAENALREYYFYAAADYLREVVLRVIIGNRSQVISVMFCGNREE